jgi:hypothetical protein
MAAPELPPAFRAWLGRQGLNGRSVNDVCSRIKRLDGMVGLHGLKGEVDLEVAMLRSDAVRGLSPSVRSQLKRAGKLYLSFPGNRP